MNRIRRSTALGLGLATMAATSALAGSAVPGDDGLGDPFFPKAGNGGYQVDRYDVALRYRSSGKIRITEVINAQVGSTELSSFNLDFRGPQIQTLKLNGASVDFDRQGAELVIDPPGSLVPGSGIHLRIVFAGRPHQVTDPDGSKEGWTKTRDGAVAVSEPLGTTSWLAVNDHPTDKAAYALELTTPRRLFGVSNGVLTDASATARTRTTVWEQAQPMASYLAVLAIGRFEIDLGSIDGIPYVGAGDAWLPQKSLDKLFRRTRRAHTCLQEVAGPYPFASTGGIIDPSSLGFALEAQTRSYYPGPPSSGLVVHEVSHQWFGDSVSVATWDQIWLNEGFATYMEWLCEERGGGRTTQQIFNGLYSGHGPGDSAFWNPPPADVPGPEQLFDQTVYYRGAMALEVLRQAIGDGDFREVLERWATKNAYGNVNTDDLIALVTDVAGASPPEFSDWLYDEGKPPKP